MPSPLAAQSDLIIRGRRVITPTGERSASIHIQGGKIAAISPFEDVPAGVPLRDAGESIVMPGLVDTHVHINEPGRTDWEGFSSATKAAAAGGVTTIIEMPLNSIPAVTTVEAYKQKLAAAEGKLHVDVGFWGGVGPGNAADLKPLWDAGVFGFKCFLVPSGVDEFLSVDESDLRAALPILAALGAPLLVHAELPVLIEAACEALFPGASARLYSTWLASRPRAAEDQAIALLINLSREFGVHIHIVHLSSSNSIAPLRRAKAEGLPITVETCPHYLTFTAGEIPDGATHFKCAPPIREKENNDQLWAALGDATIDMIATDHSPCPPAMKLPVEGDFLRAWGGIASLQLGLAAVWTEAHRRGYAVSRLADWLCAVPARLAGIASQKGAIAVGADADIVIWNAAAKWRVDPEKLHHRHQLTPYAGRELTGIVETTYLRGHKIYDRDHFASPNGRILRRGRA